MFSYSNSLYRQLKVTEWGNLIYRQSGDDELQMGHRILQNSLCFPSYSNTSHRWYITLSLFSNCKHRFSGPYPYIPFWLESKSNNKSNSARWCYHFTYLPVSVAILRGGPPLTIFEAVYPSIFNYWGCPFCLVKGVTGISTHLLSHH